VIIVREGWFMKVLIGILDTSGGIHPYCCGKKIKLFWYEVTIGIL
jgi:hypothetical protein